MAETSGNSGALRPNDGKSAQFAVLNQLKRSAHGVEGHLYFASDNGGEGRAAAFVGDVQDIRAAHRLE
jgi:hypothetical protein